MRDQEAITSLVLVIQRVQTLVCSAKWILYDVGRTKHHQASAQVESRRRYGIWQAQRQRPGRDPRPAKQWGKIVVRRAFGEHGPGLDVDLDAMEQVAAAA